MGHGSGGRGVLAVSTLPPITAPTLTHVAWLRGSTYSSLSLLRKATLVVWLQGVNFGKPFSLGARSLVIRTIFIVLPPGTGDLSVLRDGGREVQVGPLEIRRARSIEC